MEYVILTAKGLAKYSRTDTHAKGLARFTGVGNHVTEGKRYLIQKKSSNSIVEIACDRNMIAPLCHGEYLIVE